jgi:RNA polymerase sigma-70 factor (ECF subfamily)
LETIDLPGIPRGRPWKIPAHHQKGYTLFGIHLETFYLLSCLITQEINVADNETVWVRQAQKGDKQAFCELVILHQTFVYNLALRASGNAQEAQDLTQEAFLKAWLSLPRFRLEARFRTWLYRIVINLCYNRHPHLKRELESLTIDESLDLPGTNVEADPLQAMEITQQRLLLHQKIAQLPATYRMLIQLRYHQELSYDEIAQIMDMPLGTVKTGLFRAHAQLRTFLVMQNEENYATIKR